MYTFANKRGLVLGGSNEDDVMVEPFGRNNYEAGSIGTRPSGTTNDPLD
jgi:hypothetical protein